MLFIMMIVYQYTIRVSAENALGEGLPSGKQTVKTLQEAPEGAQATYNYDDHAFMFDVNFLVPRDKQAKSLSGCESLGEEQ